MIYLGQEEHIYTHTSIGKTFLKKKNFFEWKVRTNIREFESNSNTEIWTLLDFLYIPIQKIFVT